MKEREFVTLAKFSSIEQVYVVTAMLDAMGIENMVVNDISADVLPMLERDVKIIVNNADYQKAKEIMAAKFDKESFKTDWKDKK